MNRWILLLIASMGLSSGAVAQSPPGGVTESTDPARAAAIERKAQEIRRRAASGEAVAGVGIVRGATKSGAAFLSGGITVGDRVSMHAERQRYSLWIATVAKPSGAYLSDARMRIVKRGDPEPVLDRVMDGPWFMVALPAGSYELTVAIETEGKQGLQTQTQRVSVPAKGQRQAVFRFESSAEVSPEMQSPFKGNPFGSPNR